MSRASNKRQADPSAANTPGSTALLLVEIATLAHGLEALLIEIDVGGNKDLHSAAISMALHIGWIADHAAMVAGGAGNSVRGGEAEAWFLPAACREAGHDLRNLGARRPGAAVALAQGGAA